MPIGIGNSPGRNGADDRDGNRAETSDRAYEPPSITRSSARLAVESSAPALPCMPSINAIMHIPPDEPLSDAAIERAQIEFGHRLRAWREVHGWSQVEASKRAGVSQPAWSRAEAGKRSPTLVTTLRMQHALGIESIESFFGDHPSRRAVSR
jgi:DNA-binding XRE family transcriptional regulator